MKISVMDTKLRRYFVEIDDSAGASVATLKMMIANMSPVPANFVPKLVYNQRILSDGESLGSIGYTSGSTISLVCVRAAVNSASIAPLSAPTRALQAGSDAGVVTPSGNAGQDYCLTAAPLVPRPFNVETDWKDEDGRVCPKNVDYSRQCPKGHDLVPIVHECQCDIARLRCRICHESIERQHASLWQLCSVSGCCGGYAVCGSCVSVLSGPPADDAGTASNDTCTLVCSHLHWAV
jgi:hypothetical protein